MVEKRFGIEYTLNFGDTISWIAIVAVLTGMIVPILLAKDQR